jgi:glycosyltransferase involved in cell wall biosynthesis
MAAAISVAVAHPETAPNPRLSVIVPAHNNGNQLRHCLEALRGSAYPNFEIIVVDDCSTEDICPIVNRYGARYVRTASNIGPAGARNLGVQRAEGEIVVFVDSDVAVAPDVLPRIARNFLRAPALSAVFGSYDEHPACNDFLSQHKNLMHHYIHQISSEEAISFWAGCGAIRKSVFLEFGGFDAVNFPRPSIEDIELGHRMTQAGKKILLDKKLQVKHLKQWTLLRLLHADIFCRAVPWAKLILETRQLPRDLNLTYSARASAVLVGLLVAGLLLLPLSLAPVPLRPAPLHLLLAIAVMVIALLLLNQSMYRWFVERRGYRFTAGVVLLHWLYYFYSGIAFAFCALTYRPSRSSTRRTVVVMPAVEPRD